MSAAKRQGKRRCAHCKHQRREHAADAPHRCTWHAPNDESIPGKWATGCYCPAFIPRPTKAERIVAMHRRLELLCMNP